MTYNECTTNSTALDQQVTFNKRVQNAERLVKIWQSIQDHASLLYPNSKPDKPTDG